MPTLQRIEISNFLNSQRVVPWRPDWPHQIFEINGENAALNIPNGKGKSTMSTAILSMLAAHKKSLKDIGTRFFAPLKTGNFTHIRIQVLIPLPGSGGGDLVSQSGGEIGGMPMVFGMYGNSGENEKVELYSYQGTFEACPIAHVHGLRHTLIADDVFLGQLKACEGLFPSNHKERTRLAWQAYVEGFFDMASIKQQLGYQIMRGAEGGSGYFEVKPPAGMSYSEAVFYERLAPELLVDVMGDLGEDGEHGIEDTIHEKVSKIIASKFETKRKGEELLQAENMVRELESLVQFGGGLRQAKEEYDKHREQFSIEFAVLRDVLIDDPIPGVPRIPDESVPAIARSMVMQEGRWYVPDRVMAEFSGEPASDVNRRAQERKGLALETASKSQVIDFACHIKNRDSRGKPNQLYSRDAALGLVGVTTNFTRDWTRETATDALTRAFDWVEVHADTNPGRRLKKALDASLKDNQSEWSRLSTKLTDYQKEKESLLTERSQVDAQQSAYRRMVESGLFTVSDLMTPAATGIAARNALTLASGALDTHKDRVSRLNAVHASWQAFTREREEVLSPGALAERLIANKGAAKTAVDAAADALQAARHQRPNLLKARDDAATRHTTARNRLTRYEETAPAAAKFVEVFGEVPPVGLAKKVSDERDAANNRIGTIKVQRSLYVDGLQALEGFRAVRGNADPASWLKTCLNDWDRFGAEIKALEADLAEAGIRRASLDQAVIVAGKVTREAVSVAGGNHSPLHVAIERMSLDQARRESVLTLFSALLHAPVYATTGEAIEAAQRLEGEGIEAPVFVSGELESFCQTGEISMDAAFAHTWLVGIRTRQVECLLDPSLVEREKAREDARITDHGKQIEDKRIEQAKYSSESADASQARKAAEAVKNEYESKDAALAEELNQLERDQPMLVARSTPEMLEVIRLTERHQKEFCQTAKSPLQEEVQSGAQAQIHAANAFDGNEENIQANEGDHNTKSRALIAAIGAANQVEPLLKIQAYIDHPEDNPDFMAQAAEQAKQLASARSAVDARTRFEFDLADIFKNSGDARPREIEERLGDINRDVDIIQRKLLPDLTEKNKEINEQLLQTGTDVREIDEFVRDLIKGYRAYADERVELVPVGKERIESTPLGGAAVGLRSETSDRDLTDMLVAMKGDAEYENTAARHGDMRDARSAHETARSKFSNSVDMALVKPGLGMPDHIKMELERAKDAPEMIAHLHAVAYSNYDKNMAANDVAARHLSTEWENIGKWLKAFTQRLPDNLTTMKRVFGPLKNESGEYTGAGFDIDATVADQSDVKSVLDEVVAMVEKHERSKAALENAAPGLRDQATKGIRQEIRNTFYRKVITKAKIRIYMPSMSRTPLLLEKNMASTGQGIAMTLLWIVKMADYVTERELRRVTTSRAQQRHLHRTQFALMDGAFSSLSNKDLIRDAWDSITQTRGRFQLVIPGHDENYQNNFEYFPTLITARELNGQYMHAESETRRILEPDQVGSHYGAMNVINLRIKPRVAAAAVE
jgi:hypothetical protein